MSHLRFYRAILSHESETLSRDKVADAVTLRLSSCTLRLCRLNKHGFCTTFPFYDPLYVFVNFIEILVD